MAIAVSYVASVGQTFQELLSRLEVELVITNRNGTALVRGNKLRFHS